MYLQNCIYHQRLVLCIGKHVIQEHRNPKGLHFPIPLDTRTTSCCNSWSLSYRQLGVCIGANNTLCMLKQAPQTDVLWNCVFISFSFMQPADLRLIVLDAMQYWENYSCNQFVPRTSQMHYAHFILGQRLVYHIYIYRCIYCLCC